MEDYKKVSWPDWETVELIGHGSYGAVYKIERKVFHETEFAALKVISIPKNNSDIEELYSDGYDDESITSTFQSHLESIVAEYSLMRKMTGSANIVNCDDVRYVQHDDGIGWDIFIKMELLTPLTKALPSEVPDETVIKLAKDMCRALILCKKHGIVHRDIKPQNIFVSKHGDYKLGDFGIAKTVEKTTGGTKIGTYKYMAPEVYNNQPYGSAADIYSLGLVLYWLLNKRRMPFLPLPPAKLKAGQDEDSRYRRLSGEPIPEPVDGSEELKRIVLKACAYEIDNRYSSAEQMLADLDRLSGEHLLVDNVIAHSDTDNDFEKDLTMGPVFGAKQPKTEALDVKQEPHFDELDTDKTMGPVFGAKQPKTEALDVKQEPHFDELDTDKTMGPVFGAKQPKTEVLDVKQEPHFDELDTDKTMGPVFSNEIKKKKESNPSAADKKQPAFIKYALIALGAIVVIVGLILALRSCSGTTNDPFDGIDSIGDIGNIESTGVTGGIDNTVSTESTESTGSAGVFQQDWTDWMDELPSNITDADYEIEELTLYRSRTQETTSSTTQSSMAGWELYHTANGNGDYGSWSAWSTQKVSDSSTREVQTQVRYRYRTKETTTSSSSTKSGWELYDTTSAWGSYGNWSAWSTTAATKSESRNVETKTQYRYRSISYTTETTWSAWSNWSAEKHTASEQKKVETRTAWAYYYYTCPSCGAHMYGRDMYCPSWAGGCGKGWIKESYRTQVWSTTSWNNAGLEDWKNTGMYAAYVDGQLVFKDATNGSQTQYRYSTKSTKQVTNYGSWSSWTDTVYSNTSTRQVETQKVYRYQDRTKIYTYYFWRWGSWSNWSETPVSKTSDRDVESATYYRYRDKTTQTTYYFRKWSEWSEFTEEELSGDGVDVEVEAKTQYRYRSRNS